MLKKINLATKTKCQDFCDIFLSGWIKYIFFFLCGKYIFEKARHGIKIVRLISSSGIYVILPHKITRIVLYNLSFSFYYIHLGFSCL